MGALTRRSLGPLLLAATTATAATAEDAEVLAIYVLIDVSASYYKELARVVKATKALMSVLHARDSFSVAEIGACSYSDDAVVVKPFTLPGRPSARHLLIIEAAKRLDDHFRKRNQTQYTDIRGALTQAAQYLG